MPLFSFFLEPCPPFCTFDATSVFREHVLSPIGDETIPLQHLRTTQKAVEPKVIPDNCFQCSYHTTSFISQLVLVLFGAQRSFF